MAPRIATPLDAEERRRHKLRNLAQSVILLGGMAGLLALCGWLIFGLEGLVWVLAGAGLGLAFGPRLSPRLVLRLYRGRELTPTQFPEGYEILGALATRAGLPRVPRLYYLPSAMLNAFAVGDRNDAVIALTDGMLRGLAPRELAGVLAHEISHIRNNDLWLMSLADAISRLTALMSYAGMVLLILGLPMLLVEGGGLPWLLVLLLVLAPTLVNLLQLALSRAREFDADLDAAGLTGDPAGLAAALEKLERVGALWERVMLPGRRVPDPSLLRSHPPTAERIRRLLALQRPEEAPWPQPARAFGLPEPFAPVRRRPRYHLPGLWY